MEKVLKADVVPLKWSEMKNTVAPPPPPPSSPSIYISKEDRDRGMTPIDTIVGPGAYVIDGDTIISVPKGEVLFVY